jgi:hypothetical protein
VRGEFTRQFQASYDDRFEWGLIHSSSGKLEIGVLHRMVPKIKNHVRGNLDIRVPTLQSNMNIPSIIRII